MSYLNFIFEYPNIGTEEGVTQVGSQTGLGKIKKTLTGGAKFYILLRKNVSKHYSIKLRVVIMCNDSLLIFTVMQW